MKGSPCPGIKGVFCLWWSLYFLLTSALAQDVLTLEEALKKALAQNPALKARHYEVKASQAATRAEKGKLLPQIDFTAQARRRSDPQAVVPIKGPGKFPAFSRDLYSAEFEMVLPLYEGGRLRQQIKIAEAEETFRESLKRQTLLDLIANVKDIYFYGIYLQHLIKAQEITLKALREEEKEARLKLKIGRLAPLDLLRIRTQVKAQEAALVRSREDLQRTKEALCVLMGEEPRGNFLLTGKLRKSSLELPKVNFSKALSTRPDIRAQRQALEKAREKLKFARREHFPALDLYSSYGRRAGSGLNDDEEVWEAGLKFRVNIFSGGTISARIAEAQAHVLAEEERLRQKELAARREIREALSRLQETREMIIQLDQARQTAKEAFRVESLRYRTGAGTVTDMLSAQAAWLEAEANYLGALYRYKKAEIFLKRALGELDVTEKSGQN